MTKYRSKSIMNYVTTQNNWNTIFTLLKIHKEHVDHYNVKFVHIEGNQKASDTAKEKTCSGEERRTWQFSSKAIRRYRNCLGCSSKATREQLLLSHQVLVKKWHSNVLNKHIEDRMKPGKWFSEQQDQKKEKNLTETLKNNWEMWK